MCPSLTHSLFVVSHASDCSHSPFLDPPSSTLFAIHPISSLVFVQLIFV
jgi:hypothetical protein